MVSACLYGAREGLLLLHWDLLCPLCRIPSEVKETLRALKGHGHCEACNIDYELDFANSVEMIFQAHPDVRDADVRTYCIGGPAHFPHVVAQVRIAPDERLELDLTLGEGAYRLRGPQLPHHLDFRVQDGMGSRRLDVELGAKPDVAAVPRLTAGRQTVVLRNPFDLELVIRVERMAIRDDALTAAMASSLALFRELFPGEVLSPGQLVSVATLTFLVTAVADARRLYGELGDAKTFGMVREHFRLADEAIKSQSGALVKTVGEGVLGVFREPHAAVRAAFALPELMRQDPATRNLHLRQAIHSGLAMAATINDHLDYFGQSVNSAWQLLDMAHADEVVLSDTVASHADVTEFLRSKGLTGTIIDVRSPRTGLALAQRFRT